MNFINVLLVLQYESKSRLIWRGLDYEIDVVWTTLQKIIEVKGSLKETFVLLLFCDKFNTRNFISVFL